MASSASTPPRLARAVLVAVVLLVASPAAMRAGAASCDGEKFAAGTSYDACADLPTLGATLHWTHDAEASTLAVAFAATPPAAAGWVAWGINPTGDGMKGAQALVAFHGGAAASNFAGYVVNTYNITGYRPFPDKSTPIAFAATGLAADQTAGRIRLYGKLQLPKGTTAVNHLWQVGSTVTNGAPVKHAFAKDNLESKGKLVLTGAPEPAPAPVAGGPSGDGEFGEAATSTAAASPAPSGGNSSSPSSSSASTTYMPASAAALVIMPLLAMGFLAFV